MGFTYEQDLLAAIAVQRSRIIAHSTVERNLKRELLHWYDREKERYEDYLSRNLSPRQQMELYVTRDKGTSMNTANRSFGSLW